MRNPPSSEWRQLSMMRNLASEAMLALRTSSETRCFVLRQKCSELEEENQSHLIKKSLPRKIATFGNKRDHSFLHQWQSPKSRKEKPCLRSYWGKNLKRVSRRMEGSRRSTYIHAAFCPAPQKLTKTVGRDGAKLTIGVDYTDFGLWRE